MKVEIQQINNNSFTVENMSPDGVMDLVEEWRTGEQQTLDFACDGGYTAYLSRASILGIYVKDTDEGGAS